MTADAQLAVRYGLRAAASPVGAAILLIGVQIAVRAWALGQSWFWQDDFVLTNMARTVPLLEFLAMDYHGHLQPGQSLIVVLLAGSFPLDWQVHAAVLLLLQLIVDLVFLRLLVELFGARFGILVPLVVFLFCPITITPLLWFAAAIQWLPLALCTCLILLLHVRLLRRPQRRTRWAALVVMVVGVLFWERALLLPVIALLAEALWLSQERGLRRWTSVLRREPRLWLSYGAAAAVYVIAYRLLTEPVVGADPTIRKSAALVWEMVSAWTIGMLGGPWAGPGPGSTLPPTLGAPWTVLLLATAALLVLLGVARRGRRAALAWAVPLLVLLADAVVIVATRIDFLGPAIGRDPRYMADVVPLGAIALGVAFLPWRWTAPSQRAPGSRLSLRQWPRRPRLAALAVPVVMTCYVVACLVTTVQVSRDRDGEAGRDWVTTARAEMASLPKGTAVFDSRVPDFLIGDVFMDEARASAVLGSLPEAEDRFGRPSDDMRALDAQGALPRSTVITIASVPPGDVPDCGYLVGGPLQRLAVEPQVPEGDWLVRIGYVSGAGSLARLDIGDRRVSVNFPAGMGYLFVPHQGPVTDLALSGIDRDRSVCVVDVVIGSGWPEAE